MDYRFTQQALDNLTTDHVFTRSQVMRILAELDKLAGECDPRHPQTVDVCRLRDFEDEEYRLKIQEPDLKCRILFELWDAEGLIVVWSCLLRTDNVYKLAELLLVNGKAGV